MVNLRGCGDEVDGILHKCKWYNACREPSVLWALSSRRRHFYSAHLYPVYSSHGSDCSCLDRLSCIPTDTLLPSSCGHKLRVLVPQYFNANNNIHKLLPSVTQVSIQTKYMCNNSKHQQYTLGMQQKCFFFIRGLRCDHLQPSLS